MNCIICGNNDFDTIYSGLSKCKNCELIFYQFTNNKINVNDLYKENYFKGEEYLDYKNDKEIIQKNFRSRLKNIMKYIKSGNLLEIGCAYGYFLELAKKYFKISGIDITAEPTQWARKNVTNKIKTADYLKTPFEKQDLICMWDTIEHLEFPDKFIEKISKELKPNGYLFLTTGDIGSLLAKISKKNWRLIHPPTHIYYFSKKTITLLLDKFGLKVVNITYPGYFRSLKQIIYSLFFLSKKNRTFRFSNNFDIPVYFNTYDIMLITAVKK